MPVLSKVYSFVQNFILSMILPSTDKGIGSYLFSSSWTGFWEGVFNFFYSICKWFLAFLDFLQYFIQKLIGLDYWLDRANNGNRNLVDATSEDMIFKFLYADSVQKVFRALVAVFVVLLIIFTIYAIIKSEWDYMTGDGDKSNSKASIFRSSIKAIALVIVFPVLLVMGIVSSNAILASIINAVGVDMSETFGGKLFAISASQANKYYHYVDANTYYPTSDKVVFYLNEEKKQIKFGNAAEDEYHVYYSDYKEYLNAAASANNKYEINSIFDPLVPKKEKEFTGFCFRVENENTEYKYYLVKATSDNKEAIYYYLTRVLGAKVLNKNSTWATDETGFGLKSGLDFETDANFDNSYIKKNELHKASEVVRDTARNSWDYSLIYMNPGVSLSQSIDSCGNQKLSEYCLGDSGVGSILYNSDYVASYFDGGQFGVVQSRSEYGVMSDVVNFMCDNGLTFYIMDATSTLINWNADDYKVDSKWISSNLSCNNDGTINKASSAIKLNDPILDSELGVDRESEYLTFLTSYSTKGTLPCEREQDVIYTAKFDAADESMGSRYIICLKQKGLYIPLINGKKLKIDNKNYTFKSDYYSSDYAGVVWAKGTFDTSEINGYYGMPTYLTSTIVSNHQEQSKLEKLLKVDNTTAYYYSFDSNEAANKKINLYTYNTRSLKSEGFNPFLATYNEGCLYADDSKDDADGKFNFENPNTSGSLIQFAIDKDNLKSKDKTYIKLKTTNNKLSLDGKFDGTYTFTYTGVKKYKNPSITGESGSVVDWDIYYQFASASNGICYILYVKDGSTYEFYQPSEDNVSKVGEKISGQVKLTPCYKNGDKLKFAPGLVVDSVDIGPNATLGEWAKNEAKNTFSIFSDKERENYVANFTKTKPTKVDGLGNVNENTKKVEISSGEIYYNINTEGLISGDSKDVVLEKMIKFYEETEKYNAVSCCRNVTQEYEHSSLGDYLIEINIVLFGIWDFNVAPVQEVSNVAKASSVFVFAGDNEGITFDYFFDKNIQLTTFYSAYKIHYILLLISAALIIKVLMNSLWGVIKRFYMITLYYLAMPVAASTMPIDGGNRFGTVRKKITNEVLSTYGVLIGLNVFFVLLQPIEEITSTIFTEEIIANSGSYFLKKLPISAKVLNQLIYILFILVAFTLIGEIPPFVQEFVTGEKDTLATKGEKVKSGVGNAIQSAGNTISGKGLISGVKNAVQMVPGAIPGSALMAGGAKLTAKGIKALGKAFKNSHDSNEDSENPDGGGGGGGPTSNDRDDEETSEDGTPIENDRDDGEENPMDQEPPKDKKDGEDGTPIENDRDDGDQEQKTDENGNPIDNQDGEDGTPIENDRDDGENKDKENGGFDEGKVRKIVQNELKTSLPKFLNNNPGVRSMTGTAGVTAAGAAVNSVQNASDVLRQTTNNISTREILNRAVKDGKIDDLNEQFFKKGSKYEGYQIKKGKVGFSILDKDGKKLKGDELLKVKAEMAGKLEGKQVSKARGKLAKKKAAAGLIGKTLLAAGVVVGGLAFGAVGIAGAAVAAAGISKLTKAGIRAGRRYRTAGTEERSKLVNRWGSTVLKVAAGATAGALTGGLALGLAGAAAGVLVSRRAAGRAKPTAGQSGWGYENVTGTHNIQQTRQQISNYVDAGSPLGQEIQNIIINGYPMNAQTAGKVVVLIVDKSALNDKRFTPNKSEAYKNVVINTIGQKGSRAVVGDAINNFASQKGVSIEDAILNGYKSTDENGNEVEHEALLSKESKLMLYKAKMNSDQRTMLDQKVEAGMTSVDEQLNFIENLSESGGLGLKLGVKYDYKKGVTFAVGDDDINKNDTQNAAVNSALRQIVGSANIDGQAIEASLKTTGLLSAANKAAEKNYALTQNFQTDDGNPYRQAVLDKAAKNEGIVAEAVLAYLQSHPDLFERFKSEYHINEDTSKEQILESISSGMKNKTKGSVFENIKDDDYKNELAEVAGQKAADGSFKVSVYKDLLSPEEKKRLLDEFIANTSAMNVAGVTYGLTGAQIQVVNGLSRDMIKNSDSAFVEAFLNNTNNSTISSEDKSVIVNNIVGSHFGLNGENGAFDINSAGSKKLLAEISANGEMSKTMTDLTKNANYSEEDVFLAYAKSKLSGKADAETVKDIIGTSKFDTKAVEAIMSSGQSAAPAEDVNLVSNKKLVENVVNNSKDKNALFNKIALDSLNLENNNGVINTSTNGYLKMIDEISARANANPNDLWNSKLNQAGEDSDEAQAIITAYAKAKLLGKEDNAEEFIGAKANTDSINNEIAQKLASYDAEQDQSAGQINTKQALENLKGMYVASANETFGAGEVASIVKSKLSQSQIDAIINSGASNGILTLPQAQQSAILVKIASQDEGAQVVLSNNNVNLSSPMEISQFLNSSAGEILKERLLSMIQSSLYEIVSKQLGKTEDEIFEAIKHQTDKQQKAELYVESQGDLISNERVKSRLTNESNSENAGKVVDYATGRISLLTKDERDRITTKGTYKYLEEHNAAEVEEARNTLAKTTGFSKMSMNEQRDQIIKAVESSNKQAVLNASVVGGANALKEATFAALSNSGLARQREVANVIYGNDDTRRSVEQAYERMHNGAKLGLVSEIERNNFLFNNYDSLVSSNSESGKKISDIFEKYKDKVDLTHGGNNEAALKRLNQAEFNDIIGDMKEDGTNIVKQNKQDIFASTADGELSEIPDESLMTNEERREFNNRKSKLQQNYLKDKNSEDLANLYRNNTLINEDETLKQILSNEKPDASNDEIAKAKLAALKNNEEFYAKVVLHVMSSSKENKKALDHIINKLKSTGVDYNKLTDSEKASVVTKLLQDSEFTKNKKIKAKDINSAFDKELGVRSITATNQDIKMGLTKEQINHFLSGAGAKTRENLINIGAFKPEAMFKKSEFEESRRFFAANDQVARGMYAYELARSVYSEEKLRQLIRQHMMDPRGPMFDRKLRHMTSMEVDRYITANLARLTREIGEYLLMNRDGRGNYQVNGFVSLRKQEQIINDLIVQNRVFKNRLDSTIAKVSDIAAGQTKKGKSDKVLDELCDKLINRISEKEKLKKSMEKVIKTSVQDQIESFLKGNEVSVLVRDTVEGIVTDPAVQERVFARHNAELAELKKDLERQIREKINSSKKK